MKPHCLLAIFSSLLLCQCGIPTRVPAITKSGTKETPLSDSKLGRNFHPSPELRARILALNPENVTESDVQHVLSQCPAPHVLLIHGGIAGVEQGMESFAAFLTGMGYPRNSICLPDGTCSYSCYENTEKMLGTLAYYYERDALRPMMVSHSQGGCSISRILHRLDANPQSSKAHVWNPVSWAWEDRTDIYDPLTGQKKPIIGTLTISFASAVGSGGLTRLLPNTYDTLFTLHHVPGTVSEFTGFCKQEDSLGGDFYGYGSTNEFRTSSKNVKLRNLWLPNDYSHAWAPYTKYLAFQPETRAWVNAYHQQREKLPPHPTFRKNIWSMNILWGADLWCSIKRNWVKELQTLVGRP